MTYIFVDDNLFYRSMRRTYFNLARKYHAGFVQMYVDCPLPVCLERNAGRRDPVPEPVLCAVASRFEEPDPVAHAWEKHTVRISSHPRLEEFPWDLVGKFSEEILPEQSDPAEKELSKTINRTNMIHQFDLHLRKIVSTFMSGVNKYTSDLSKVRAIGKELSNLKKQYLAELHKVHLKFMDEILFEALAAKFTQDMHACVEKINIS